MYRILRHIICLLTHTIISCVATYLSCQLEVLLLVLDVFVTTVVLSCNRLLTGACKTGIFN